MVPPTVAMTALMGLPNVDVEPPAKSSATGFFAESRVTISEPESPTLLNAPPLSPLI